MDDFAFSVFNVYAGYPVFGFTLLAFDTPWQTRSLLHVEWDQARLRVSGLWLSEALEFSR